MNSNRRTLLGSLGAAAMAAVSRNASAAAAAPPAEPGVSELQAAMARGKLSSTGHVLKCLSRIDRIDRQGPRLRSVIEVNPDALKIAAGLDAERRAKGARGPLHGIAVLVKDNIATGDRMSTSAGSLALANARAPHDAAVVARLRQAGAVILGKTNLSEWANLRSSHSTSGWSARGGLTLHPYALDRNPSGSSSGSAVAVAAGLASLAVGTETDGSIVSPSSICSLVGIKPTVGLLSRYGIIPISRTQDTPGPIACCVRDAALLLGAMAGVDPLDAATQAGGAVPEYEKALDPGALTGARLGLVRGAYTGLDAVDALIDRAVLRLKDLGATIVDPVELPDTKKYADAELDVLLYEFKAGLAEYLPQFAPGAPVQSLADIIAFNEREGAREMRYFSQDLLVKAQAKGGLDEAAYKDALALCRRLAREEGIDKVLADNKLDALIAPTGTPAWLTDLVVGDNGAAASFSTPAAVAGYPHITVPAGFVSGLPVGLSFVGAAFSEAKLIGYAYAYEQATSHRRPPSFARSAAITA